MNWKPKFTCAGLVALALAAGTLTTPLDAKKGGKPGGGGGDGTITAPNPEVAVVKRQRNKVPQLILMNADGSNATSIQRGDGIGGVDLSPTDDVLIYETWSGPSVDSLVGTLWLLPYEFDANGIRAASAPIALDTSPGPIWAIDFSPDGQYILYMTFFESGNSTNFYLRIRSSDPDDDEGPKTIYSVPATERYIRPGGVCWLNAAADYRIAFHTEWPVDSGESEILVYTIDPTADAGLVIPDVNSPDAVLSTTNPGTEFTVAAGIDSARTTESLIVNAEYRHLTVRKGPSESSVAGFALWHVNTGGFESLTDPFDDLWGPVGLSPVDDRLLYSVDDQVYLRDLLSGAESRIYSGAYLADWLPVERPDPAN